MINKYVNLDGEKNGIVMRISDKVPTKNGFKRKNSYVCHRDGNIKLFTNFDIAKLNQALYYKNCIVEYSFAIGKKTIPFYKCTKFEDGYHYIDLEEDARYIIHEKKEYKIIRNGYIVFEDGDVNRCEKKYGFKRRKELMLYISDMVKSILRNENDKLREKNIGITKIKKINDSELILSVYGSTAKIHILTNSRLMDVNQERKQNNIRAIPFSKDMDKFTTMYVYADKDYFDPINNNAEEKVELIINAIVDQLIEEMPELKTKFVGIEFTGYVNVMED